MSLPSRLILAVSGVGCKPDYDYEWLKTQDMYNSVLTDLNQTDTSTTGEGASGEDKADSGSGAGFSKDLPTGGRRSAMVYNRFRKSKDLNLYQKDDLAAILGGNDKRPKRILAEQAWEVGFVFPLTTNPAPYCHSHDDSILLDSKRKRTHPRTNLRLQVP